MQVPIEISFRDIDKSDAIDTLIREKTQKLEKICDYMTSCRVVVAKPQKHQHSGSPYRVRLDVRIPPGHEIVVKREPGEGDMHEPLDTVIRGVFDSAWRQVKEIVERQREDVKSHPQQEAGGLVDELVQSEGYGFLRTAEGRRVYFHRNSVLNDDFDHLEVGTGVRFVEEMGNDGPQASTVQIVDKPGSGLSS
jgi:cold shock CspA family protein/ribosome-associated translation inhibitor RaiA